MSKAMNNDGQIDLPSHGVITSETINALLKMRITIYHLFKTLFLEEPSEKFLHDILNNEVLRTLSQNYPEKNIRELIAEFLKEAEKLSRDKDCLTEVWAEYVRLFIGTPVPIVTPYESVNRGEETLKGKMWLEVRDWMLDDGMILQDNSVLEDHIGIELEYMVVMCTMSLEALRNGDLREVKRLLTRQRRFLENHLLTWLPNVCWKIENESVQRFYRILASLTDNYVKEDYELVMEIEEFIEEEVKK
ncbi:MAG: molecular chaperone TorD family protein [Nitrososphaerota archaeon]